MTVVPSLISHPAVPSHRRMTCPLFSLFGEFCPAKAQIPVATKAKDASADCRIENPSGRIPAKSNCARRQGQRPSWDKAILPNEKGGNKSRPMRIFLNVPIVRRVLLSSVRSRAQPVRRRETVRLPSIRPVPWWKSCRWKPPGRFRQSSPCRRTADA